MEQSYTPVVAPREGVNDDVARVVQWLVPDGARVEANQVIAVLETTKATFDLHAPKAGHVFHAAAAGTDVAVGSAVALLSDSPVRPRAVEEQVTSPARSGAKADEPAGQLISKKARALIERHNLPLAHFAGLSSVREADVEAVLQRIAGAAAEHAPAVRKFRGESLDPAADWDAVLRDASHEQVQRLLGALRKRLRAKYNRHVPLGTLLHDRWDVAKENNFGEGTSAYDECLILGDVRMGKNCWVGPYTILDGMHGTLTIGDHVDIGSGTHVYTHNTIERALTGHKAPLFGKSTTIGNCCFIAPKSMVAPGTVIGDHCFVAAGSYVEGSFPAYSYIAGNPAAVVGVVEIRGDRARIRRT
jgi:acetyltransferase-like isoleucine patch superfamily enzyme